MRVIVAHNRYRSSSPSGENRIVETDMALLASAGVEVVPFIEDSDELARRSLSAVATASTGPIVSLRGVRRLRSLLDRHRPDVVHLHNVFPLISPWVVRTAHGMGVPVVQTVHNYRHTCIAGLHLRDGRVCEDCVSTRTSWPGLRHACYRDSYAQSALMTAGQIIHRPTWRSVDRFLVASPFMRERLMSLGVAASSIEWRPTSADDPGAPGPSPPSGAVFVGRLSEEKGIRMLLDAWTPAVAARWGRLVVVGDGPLASHVEAAAAAGAVDWAGARDGAGVIKAMRAARLVVLPSIWFEGFPRVAAEAMALGRPLLMSTASGYSEIATEGVGWALEPNAGVWERFLLGLRDESLDSAALASRAFFERRCSPDASVRQLLEAYDRVTQG